jgi:Amino acid permease
MHVHVLGLRAAFLCETPIYLTQSMEALTITDPRRNEESQEDLSEIHCYRHGNRYDAVPARQYHLCKLQSTQNTATLTTAQLLAVPKGSVLPYDKNTPDLATLFFESLFDEKTSARRAMAALIATSIFGNLVVMTFTASRVKQEIAKEGILPFSLAFATSYITPYGLYKRWKSGNNIPKEALEHAPSAAFLLHWGSSVLLILVTLPISDPRKSYSALISLYSYTIISLLGAWVSIGLLLTKLRNDRFHWSERRRYRPWLSPAHPIIYGVACIFMLVAAFTPPGRKSPFHQSFTGITWYIVPAIGLSAPLWGLIYYAGLRLYERQKEVQLVVTRTPYWVPDPDCPGEYVQKAEIIDHAWQITPRATHGADSGWEMNTHYGVGERQRDDGESNNSQDNIGAIGRIWPNRGTRRGTGLADERTLSRGFEE